METITIKRMCKNPELAEKAAKWFSEKWDIPVEAYYDSIQKCIEQKNNIPQWYVVLNNSGKIIAGAGVIENDFHVRKDLSPNLCALFVEEKYRKQAIAKCILNFVRKDLGNMGIEKLYLVTDHTKFYEKYSWDFLIMVNDDDGTPERMYVTTTL